MRVPRPLHVQYFVSPVLFTRFGVFASILSLVLLRTLNPKLFNHPHFSLRLDSLQGKPPFSNFCVVSVWFLGTGQVRDLLWLPTQ